MIIQVECFPDTIWPDAVARATRRAWDSVVWDQRGDLINMDCVIIQNNSILSVTYVLMMLSIRLTLARIVHTAIVDLLVSQ